MSKTIRQDTIIVNRRGLHARASAKVAKEAAGFDAQIKVEKDGVAVTATSIMGLMMLGAARGDTVGLLAEGPEADIAMQSITDLIKRGFDETD